MDFFKYFTTGLTLATVDKLSKKVKSTSTFKYFSDSDTNMVKEYKDFNVTIIASALAVIALEMDIKKSKS
jgi:predicted mannosyl-3-phosphoglycerate phosphatase (HAD superfamily)